jgi:hypothetical protein
VGALFYLSFTWFTARRAKKKIRSQVNGKNTAFNVPDPVSSIVDLELFSPDPTLKLGQLSA